MIKTRPSIHQLIIAMEVDKRCNISMLFYRYRLMIHKDLKDHIYPLLFGLEFAVVSLNEEIVAFSYSNKFLLSFMSRPSLLLIFVTSYSNNFHSAL